MAYQYRILLTEEEYFALSSIIENGWGNGDFAGYAGVSENVQESAMNKYKNPQKHSIASPKRKKPKNALGVAMLLAKGNAK